ncbi:pyocin knob domain-containing protein [Mixta intestinalis]|uniref:Putative tail fiber protein gp53-like C-terminal domain-containing protein n=1 Tax=Mixta intestinalis TaxID=1615494 RepID=A0A6P1Q037_9GAMM|nr:pyocin knob domain-containing protein [Mixta intestinalis]QHM71682.1 hypothetical protein C7M51_01973 [Mixta intestinalis]
MFHLDNNSGVSSMPAVGAMQDNTTRWFTEGAGTQSPSWPGQDWFNIVQAELLNVLTESGITPVKTQLNQLAAAIKSIVNKNALLRDNLLSEIKDKGASAQKAALDNLNGVPKTTTINGHSLTGNVNVTSQDIFGLSTAIGAGADLNTYQTPGIYYQNLNTNATSGTNYPESVAGTLLVLKNSVVAQIYVTYSTGQIYSRGKPSNTVNWSPWAAQYNTQNKPKASDVDAVSATNGGTFQGGVTFRAGVSITKEYPGIGLTDTRVGTGTVGRNILIEQGNGSLYIAFRKEGSTDGQKILNVPSVAGTIYSTGNKPSASDVGAYSKGESDGRYQLKNTASKATNGWHKDTTTGIIRQWGIVNVGDNTVVTANFPIPFPSACASMSVTAISQAGNNSTEIISAYGKAISKSQMKVAACANWDYHGISGVYFEATGY